CGRPVRARRGPRRHGENRGRNLLPRRRRVLHPVESRRAPRDGAGIGGRTGLVPQVASRCGKGEAQVSAPHVPVLLDEVVAALDPRPGDLIVDATFGAGGYTRAFLDAGATVHAFDRDPDAIAAGREWPETREAPPRLVLHARRFSEM